MKKSLFVLAMLALVFSWNVQATEKEKTEETSGEVVYSLTPDEIDEVMTDLEEEFQEVTSVELIELEPEVSYQYRVVGTNHQNISLTKNYHVVGPCGSCYFSGGNGPGSLVGPNNWCWRCFMEQLF